MVISVDAYAVLAKNKAIKMISSVIECVITLKIARASRTLITAGPLQRSFLRSCW